MRVVPVEPRRVGEPGDDQRLDDGRVGRGDGRMLARERLGPGGRPRHREREAAGVDESEAALGAHRDLERVDTFGRVRARVADVERVGERGPEIGAGRRFDEAVDRLDAQLVVDELDDERQDRVGPAGLGTGGPELVAVVERRLEPVVPVGQDERRAADDPADRGDGPGVVDRRDLVGDTVGIDASGQRGRAARGAR